MSNLVIKVKNISKVYQIGEYSTGTITRDIERWWKKARGKEDPFSKIGNSKNWISQSKNNFVWSLKDLNFDIKQGEAVGIVGRNGSGKSTLLKILSRVTSPSTGEIKVKGRIASLLEVGTGFHPELTGRENIYLNGTILGMRKKEVKTKFDEIVDFSGVEQYIDTPVKRYSSGMYIRLAFAIAAYLESEILFVDEVLAVGDAEFQNKCIGKMKEVSSKQGKTILFVSHNTRAIQKICTKGLLLEKGHMTCNGDIEFVLSRYIKTSEMKKSIYHVKEPENINGSIGFVKCIKIENQDHKLIDEICLGEPWQVKVFFTLNKKVNQFIIGLGMVNSADINIRTSWSEAIDLNAGNYIAVLKENTIIFSPETYYLTVNLASFEHSFQYLENVAFIRITDIAFPSLDKSIIRLSGVGVLLNPMSITIHNQHLE